MAPAAAPTWIDAPAGPMAVRLAGPEGAPGIVLLHGWSQSSLAFEKQLAGALAARFRLAAVDLRGHGASPAPADPSAYGAGAAWADDLLAVLQRLDWPDPVLVGWSMGGWVIGDFLAAHGPAGLGGIVTVGTVPRIGAAGDPALVAKRKTDARAEGMFHADPAVQLDAAIAFAKAMTAAPLSKRDLAWLVGQMVPCPPALRRAARTRDADWRPAFQRARAAGVPAQVIQGAADRLCFPPQAAETAEALGAAVETIPGAGHLPFWERAETFDAILADFMDRLGR
ncbi:MAG: alpha/beta fold hydrolase [Pseudomonadota bacterium]